MNRRTEILVLTDPSERLNDAGLTTPRQAEMRDEPTAPAAGGGSR
jgi:type VI secretion system protein ImpK